MKSKKTRKIDGIREELMTVQEVSAYLRLPRSTVYDLASKGKIPGVKFGKHWRFLKRDIQEYLYGSNTKLISRQRNYPGVSSVDPSKRFVEKRVCPRLKSEISAQISGLLSDTKENKKVGCVRNISEGGVCFELQDGPYSIQEQVRDFGIGDPIDVRFQIPGEEGREMKLEARIVYQRTNGTSHYGIKFRRLSGKEKEILREYVG